MKLVIKEFFDSATYTLSYIVYDQETRDAIVIDPVLDYDPAASKISDESVLKLENFLKHNELKLHYILETHAHADHITGAMELKKRFPNAQVAIGEKITEVQSLFSKVYNLKDFNTNGVQFDLLLNEKDPLKAGSIEIKTIHTPGHTPACSSYLIGDNIFTGDTLFMPDYGTGRCDFPAGSSSELYHSIHEKLYTLPDEVKVYTGHDYQPNGRELKFVSTIGESKKNNIQLKNSTTKEEFVAFRDQRDATLNAPRLLLPSLQINIDAGHLPREENNGVKYLKIPLRLGESNG